MRKKGIITLVLLLAIGFAAISTTLIINGNLGVKTNQDDYIDGLVFDEENLSSSNKTKANISPSGRTLSFTTQTMTNVNETSTVYFQIKNYSQYNVTLGTPAIICYFVDNHEIDKKATPIDNNPYMELIPGHELDGETINAGGGLSEESYVTVKQTMSYVGDDTQEVKFQCEINATAGDSVTPAKEKPILMPEGYYFTNDSNENNIVDAGDEIRVGTESFYVISKNDRELNALAKYNLNVGDNKNPNINEGIQHKSVRGRISSGTTYGNVKFSNNKGWTIGEDIDIRNTTYTKGPIKEALYGEKGYEAYIQDTISTAKVRLIKKSEIETLINEGNELSAGSINGKADEKGYPWLYYTGYWTESASLDGDIYVYHINAGGRLGNLGHHGIDYCCGVRPVITLSLGN